MRLRSVHCSSILLLAGALSLAAFRTSAQSTNSSDAARSTALQNLDDKFGKPFGTFKQPASDDPFGNSMIVNVPQPYLGSRKARDLLDKSENWAFLTPSDYNDQGTIEEAIGAPASYQQGGDGKKTAIERFNEQGMRHSMLGTNQSAGSGPNSQQNDDPTEPGPSGVFGKTTDPNGTDGINEAFKVSKFDTTSPVFADPNSTWGFSDAFGRKETKDEKDKLDRDRDAEQSRPLDADKDFFQRLQAEPTFSAAPDTGAGNSDLGSLNSLPNPLLDPSSQATPASLPEMPVAPVTSDFSPGMQPASVAPPADTLSPSETAIAPVLPGSAPAASDSGQPDLSRFSMPQPIYAPPKRPF